ncbi:MAG TPA: alpha/beta fold hydrolase [Candidatus Saccharimonadales bacterium]|nr:alpha/beta fold hydrolase [Candidatus Saccharimonadales bacterium]
MHNILFVPGCGKTAEEGYPKTLAALAANGFNIDAVNPPWEKQSFADELAYTSEEIARKLRPNTIVVAHSYGCVLALAGIVAASRPRGVILASPSVNCFEGWQDEQVGRPLINERYAEQSETIQAYSLAALTKQVRVKHRAAVLLGEAEALQFPIIADLAKVAANNLGVEPSYASSAGHFIDHYQSYVDLVANTANAFGNSIF